MLTRIVIAVQLVVGLFLAGAQTYVYVIKPAQTAGRSQVVCDVICIDFPQERYATSSRLSSEFSTVYETHGPGGDTYKLIVTPSYSLTLDQAVESAKGACSAKKTVKVSTVDVAGYPGKHIDCNAGGRAAMRLVRLGNHLIVIKAFGGKAPAFLRSARGIAV